MSYAHNNIFTGEITDDEVWLGDEGIMEEFILDETCTSECEVGEESEDSTMCALSRWLLVFLVHLQAQFHLSDGILGALLRFLKAFRVLGRFSSLCVQEWLKMFLVHCTSLVTHTVHCEIVLGVMWYVENVTLFL